MYDKKLYVYLRFITINLLIIGGLTWGVIGVTNINPITRLTKAVNLPYLSRVIYSLIGLAALIFAFKFYNRDTFLPFLGKTIFPVTRLNLGYPLNYDHQAVLNAPEDAKYILYWAAQAKENIKDPYGQFSNSGAVGVKNGKVTIRFQQPNAYTIGNKKIEAHVHYRWLNEDGLMSRIHKLKI